MSPSPKTVPSAARVLVDSVTRYADLHGWKLGRHSHDWVLTLSRGDRRHLIHGYDLGINGSAAARIANDKSATHDVLAAANVPSVPHRVFLHPRFLDFVPVAGNWADLLATFAAFGSDAVIKDNEGTGGMEVFRVQSVCALEQRAHQLFQIARAVALSPFLLIASEQRFVMLGQECLFAYGKERVSVTGDGVRTVAALAAAANVELVPDTPCNQVPAAGEVVPLQWRHNLGKGARAAPFEATTAPHALELARAAMQALDLTFASVDIVRLETGYSVLEVNAGVMLEMLVRGGLPEEGARLADTIYHRALDQRLAANR